MRVLVAVALSLSGCAGEQATCVRKSDGVALHGTVWRLGDGSIREYQIADENGLWGRIDASNSREFVCKVNPS